MKISGTQPLLVAVDFSAGSDEAFEWAVELANAFDAPLHVLHVAHDPEDEPGSYASRDGEEIQPIEVVARDRLAAFLESQHDSLAALTKVRSDVVVGLPATRILEVAARDDAQAIVMGAQGRTALADRLLGSKAERVAQRSPIPVLLIKSHGRESVR